MKLSSDLQKKIIDLQNKIYQVENDISTLSFDITINSKAIELAKESLFRASKSRKYAEEILSQVLSYVYEPAKFQFLEHFKDDVSVGFKYQIVKNGLEFFDIQEDLGFGHAAICDFMLQVLSNLFSGQTAPILICDEALPELDPESWQKFGEWFVTFCTDNDFQCVFITQHHTEFGIVYTVKQEKGVSSVERISY